MSPSPRDAASPEHLVELDRELDHARQALLAFAEEEDLLPGLVAGENTDPQRLHADVDTARGEATVEELLWIVGRAPHREDVFGEDEAHPLYPALLALAEAFDILIDQFSLVYGDAVALAQAIWPGWHAMAGCHGHEATPEQASEALERMRRNVASLHGLLSWSERLPPDEKTVVAGHFAEWGEGALARESRRLARHALETWMPRGLDDATVAAALAGGRSAADPFRRATADLLLSRVCSGTCRSELADALSLPFAGSPPS